VRLLYDTSDDETLPLGCCKLSIKWPKTKSAMILLKPSHRLLESKLSVSVFLLMLCVCKDVTIKFEEIWLSFTQILQTSAGNRVRDKIRLLNLFWGFF
jgi:hypothetical protein